MSTGSEWAISPTIALTAAGLLMVYSSSAMKAYLASDDTLAVVGPQIGWAALGMVALGLMMRIDYRWLRFVSVPFYGLAFVLLLLVLPTIAAVPGRR